MNTNSLSTNRSMKIVPTLEDTLNTIGLNTQLDENVQAWFNQLTITWLTWKRSPNLEHHLQVFFETNPDRYRIALVFVAKCKESKDCKPKTLPFFIMEILYKWSSKSDTSPEDCLKFPAFRIATEQRNQQYLNLVVKTYKIVTIKETILPLVKDMLKNDNCKQASQVVLAMELYEDIPVEDLLFPLIIQDKYNMIVEYLSECPKQVLPLVLFLDKILDKNVAIRDLVQRYIFDYNITCVNYEKLHHKPLGKFVGRLCSKFNVPIETCKNLCKNRTLGGLRYLIHQKYVDHNVSLRVWDDLIKDTLKENSELALEFVYMIVNHDRKEAAKWSQFFNLPESELPYLLKKMSLNTVSPENENWDDGDENINQNFYEISLPADRIIIINTPEMFYDLTNTHLANCNLVSIDSEWKPSFGAAQSQVALIQIAVENYVYLIDTLSLNKPQYISFWHDFNKSLLDNAEIIKLGFGLEQDLKQIKGSVVGLSNIKVKGEGLLDLSTLWKNLISSGLSLQSSSGNFGNSLSSLVEVCFGYPLRKSEQRSNWEIRPLRKTQIQYAAIDAHVLVELYKFLQEKCIEQNINFEEICNDTMIDKKTKTVKPKCPEKTATSSPVQVKTVDDVKFFVESKLINYIPYLRCYGIDTLLMPDTLLWHDIINQAMSENRYILLAKLKFTPIKNYPQSSILNVGTGYVTLEMLQEIKNYFNIQIKESDLTKRCINCNASDLEQLTSEKVSELCKQYWNVSSVSNNVNYTAPTEDDYYEKCDRFLSDSEGDDDIVSTPTRNVCVTSTGMHLQIQNVQNLCQSPQAATICNSCGRLFWDGDDMYKTVMSVANNSLK
ncbi:PREDICTED: exonuclease mut-7 homolog [Papilio polytes]|uniref:exonuclease mut-7 homolog n=1 Tax=Papilio polytes TaxID=76194 RepID=UPI0006767492|nr:PREDICTED: exonuclease mut-7 homolog [Papilio polytes]